VEDVLVGTAEDIAKFHSLIVGTAYLLMSHFPSQMSLRLPLNDRARFGANLNL
jgi:hypothetical protein